MQTYKFVHLLWNKGTLFFPTFVNMLSDNPDLFKMEEHLFVTIYTENYDVLEDYCNIILEKNKKCNLINKYGKKADWIIVHSMGLPFYKVPLISKYNAKKVIWRTWGHDIRPCKQIGIVTVDFLLRLLFRLYVKKIQQFAFVGIANDIDRYSVEKYFGKLKYCKIPYSYNVEGYTKLCEIREKCENRNIGDCLNIVVGHSGFEIDNHMEALEILAHFKNENVKVFLPLSYGKTDYIECVTKKAKEIFGSKAIIISEKMQYFKYAEFLSKMDIAIFNQKYSSALGNLSLLLFFKATIFFNKDSCFVESFLDNNIKDYYTVEQLSDMSYEMLINTKMSNEIRKIYCDVIPSRLRAERFSSFLNNL